MLEFTAPGYQPGPLHPRTGLPFAPGWTILCLTDDPGYRFLCGGRDGSPYAFLVSRRHEGWEQALCDYAQYQQARGGSVLISVAPDDWARAQHNNAGRRFDEPRLRPGEPQVLVHSTPAPYYAAILRDGCLKSWRLLHSQAPGWERAPIGRLLNDPDEFSDYVMLSDGDVAGEIVVLSKQRGALVMDADAPYTPGARLYFDAAAIARDGLLLRDGAHLKVRDRLPLRPYLLDVITAADLALPRYTPATFTRAANAAFAARHPGFHLSSLE